MNDRQAALFARTAVNIAEMLIQGIVKRGYFGKVVEEARRSIDTFEGREPDLEQQIRMECEAARQRESK